MARRRRPSPSRPLIVAVCLLLFALGVGLGIYFARPPARPDFSAPDEAITRDDGAAGSRDEAERGGDARPGSSLIDWVSPGGGTSDEGVEPPPEDPMAARADEPRPEDAEAPPDGVERMRQPPPGGAPRIAIIIDDLGRSVDRVGELHGLDVPLTFSVLPFEARTAAVVAELRRLGVEYLCHLPMEALGGADSGPGSLRASMTADELRAATVRALDAVPGARGVNNHMGSAVVGDAEAMRTVLDVLGERDLFFVDSRTSAETVGYTVARTLGLPSAERQVFLDNDRRPESIRAQFRELLDVAQRRGGAVAIAHPYPETIATLREELPAARAAGIELVPVSRLLER